MVMNEPYLKEKPVEDTKLRPPSASVAVNVKKTRFKVIEPKEFRISFQRDISRTSYNASRLS
jgi:hypothetical protein